MNDLGKIKNYATYFTDACVAKVHLEDNVIPPPGIDFMMDATDRADDGQTIFNGLIRLYPRDGSDGVVVGVSFKENLTPQQVHTMARILAHTAKIAYQKVLGG